VVGTVVEALSREKPNFLGLGFSGDDSFEQNFLRHGAQGFVSKHPRHVAMAVREVASEVATLLDVH